MMPLSPPPLNEPGAITTPRMLFRWLDVNNVTKLTRTQSFVTIPPFNLAVNWLGYSDIIQTVDFKSPNALSFKSLSQVPVNPTYALAVSFVKGGQTTRYWLWKGVGEVVFAQQVLYTGQTILPNFRFEMWSTNQAAVENGFNIYTSILGNLDWMWQTDYQLVPELDTNNLFLTNNLNLPFVFPPTCVPNSN